VQPNPLSTRDASVDGPASAATAPSGVPVTHNVQGRTNNEIKVDDIACRAALATLEQSATGRVALPSSHPAFLLLASGTPSADAATGGSQRPVRTVILQAISPESCWAVASSDLLAAFTPQDLTWLGQLASYVST
jgi:hypothetical protein